MRFLAYSTAQSCTTRLQEPGASLAISTQHVQLTRQRCFRMARSWSREVTTVVERLTARNCMTPTQGHGAKPGTSTQPVQITQRRCCQTERSWSREASTSSME